MAHFLTGCRRFRKIWLRKLLTLACIHHKSKLQKDGQLVQLAGLPRGYAYHGIGATHPKGMRGCVRVFDFAPDECGCQVVWRQYFDHNNVRAMRNRFAGKLKSVASLYLSTPLKGKEPIDLISQGPGTHRPAGVGNGDLSVGRALGHEPSSRLQTKLT